MTSSSTVKSYNIVVVDDDDLSVRFLEKEIQKAGHSTLPAAHNIDAALLVAKEHSPDLFLVDINLNDIKDGVELAVLLMQEYGIPSIFVTAEIDSAVIERVVSNGFKHILSKPVKTDELKATIEIALSAKEQKKPVTEFEQEIFDKKKVLKDCIFIKEGASLVKVKYDEVKYLMSSHIYVHVVTVDKEFIVRASLKEYINRFDPELFIRIHRSYAVNVQFIETITSTEVGIKGKSLPFAKQYRDELFNRINR